MSDADEFRARLEDARRQFGPQSDTMLRIALMDGSTIGGDPAFEHFDDEAFVMHFCGALVRVPWREIVGAGLCPRVRFNVKPTLN